MATVTIYFDKRNKKKDGGYPLKLTVTHKKSFHIPLNVSVPEENWDDRKYEIVGKYPNKTFLNRAISFQRSNIEQLLIRLQLSGNLSRTTPEQLKQMIKAGNFTGEIEEEKILGESLLFRDIAKQFIDTRNAEGTKECYQYTLDTLNKLYDLNTLTFSDIDYNWLEQFEKRLRPTCKVNTLSIHLRNIRAVIKNAAKKKIISKDLNPFDEYSIKSEQTPYRNLSVEDLRLLRDYDVEPHQERYRDFFMLLFYLIGINVVDILQATGLKNGRLEYRRAKTGTLYSIKVYPEAMRIIHKYKGDKYLLNIMDSYNNYKDFRHRLNLNLKQIGESEYIESRSKKGRRIKKKVYYPLFPTLTSYYARHTWASIASQIDIPKDTIAAALGHAANTVTDRYINFDYRKVDIANRKVIDFVNGDK